MKLAQIIYEIFESDAQWLDEDDSRQIHEIDREIRLVDDEGQSTFISWSSDPVQYAIGIADVRFFNEPIPVVRDMSDSELWKGLIGENITFNFEDTHHQVLKISFSDHTVYCWTSTFADMGFDILFISTERPDDIQQER